MSVVMAGVLASMMMVPEKKIEAEATAYCLRGATASGRAAGPGICAVDPSVIPLGSLVLVELEPDKLEWYRAADTGGAIKGNKIDLWMPTEDLCLHWGRRKVNAWVFPAGNKINATRDRQGARGGK